MLIKQITIVGTGLIGGSLALALRKQGFGGEIVGCDKRSVLDTAVERHVLDRGEADLERAVVGSDVIVFATPVGTTLSQFEAIAPTLPPDRKSTRLNSSHEIPTRMPSSA